jgi:hypothetical protein
MQPFINDLKNETANRNQGSAREPRPAWCMKVRMRTLKLKEEYPDSKNFHLLSV